MKTINAIFVSMAFAAILVAPANAAITTNAVSGAPASATARLSAVPARWPTLKLAVNSGTPFSNLAACATNVSTNTQTCAMKACCEESTSPGHYSISPAGGLAKASSIERTRHAVTFFTDAAINIGRAGGNAGWSDDAAFGHLRPGGSWAGIDAGAIRQPHGLRLLSWSW